VGVTPAHSQSTAAPGSMGSPPGGSQETPIPAKPRGFHPDGPCEVCDPLIYLARHKCQVSGHGH
jgi:hypothetical protein